MFEYRLTPAAERDLEDIWIYTLQQWSENQANTYIDDLVDAFQSIASAPLVFPSCDHIRPGYRRRNMKRHVIYYRVTDYGVAIIRVLHDRMDVSNRL